MTTTDLMPALTDDEVAAVAVQKGAAWPTLLPTVADDEDSLLAAVLRGRRSLLLRQLATVTSDDRVVPAPSLLHCIDGVLGVRVQLGVYIGRDDLSALPVGLAYYWYGEERGGNWMTESTSHDGVHAFAWVTREEALDVAVRLAEAAYADGVPGTDDARIVILHPGDPTRALLVGHVQLRAVSARMDEAGSVSLVDLEHVDSPAEGLTRIGYTL